MTKQEKETHTILLFEGHATELRHNSEEKTQIYILALTKGAFSFEQAVLAVSPKEQMHQKFYRSLLASPS